MKRSQQLRRLVERELVSGVGRRRRRTLVERVRGNEDARRSWDRALTAFRVLEQREVSQFELEQVERWLFDDLEDDGVLAADSKPARSGMGRWTTLAATLASVATAAAVLLWIAPGQNTGGDAKTESERGQQSGEPEAGEGLSARGRHGWSRPLAIELVCGQPPHPVEAGGCEADDLLGFSARLGREALAEQVAVSLAERPLELSLFGIDAQGAVLYYAPTPDAALVPALGLDEGWRPLPMSVRLEVNHSPGAVRVFALASEQAPSLLEIEQWVAALAPAPLAGVDDPPWHLRVPGTSLARVCPRSERCVSAETLLKILPASTDATDVTDESGSPP